MVLLVLMRIYDLVAWECWSWLVFARRPVNVLFCDLLQNSCLFWDLPSFLGLVRVYFLGGVAPVSLVLFSWWSLSFRLGALPVILAVITLFCWLGVFTTPSCLWLHSCAIGTTELPCLGFLGWLALVCCFLLSLGLELVCFKWGYESFLWLACLHWGWCW